MLTIIKVLANKNTYLIATDTDILKKFEQRFQLLCFIIIPSMNMNYFKFLLIHYEFQNFPFDT